MSFKALEQVSLIPFIEKFWEVGLDRLRESFVLLTTIGSFGRRGEAGGRGLKESRGETIGPTER